MMRRTRLQQPKSTRNGFLNDHFNIQVHAGIISRCLLMRNHADGSSVSCKCRWWCVTMGMNNKKERSRKENKKNEYWVPSPLIDDRTFCNLYGNVLLGCWGLFMHFAHTAKGIISSRSGWWADSFSRISWCALPICLRRYQWIGKWCMKRLAVSFL